MLKITKEHNGNSVTVYIEGKVISTNAAELDAALAEIDADEIIIDCEKMEYISSAGLRVFLATQIAMDEKKGRMVIRNINDIVAELFEDTGFSDIMIIE